LGPFGVAAVICTFTFLINISYVAVMVQSRFAETGFAEKRTKKRTNIFSRERLGALFQDLAKRDSANPVSPNLEKVHF